MESVSSSPASPSFSLASLRPRFLAGCHSAVGDRGDGELADSLTSEVLLSIADDSWDTERVDTFGRLLLPASANAFGGIVEMFSFFFFPCEPVVLSY